MEGNQSKFKFKPGEPVVIIEEKGRPGLFGGNSHALVVSAYVEEGTGRVVYVTTLGDFYEDEIEPEA